MTQHEPRRKNNATNESSAAGRNSNVNDKDLNENAGSDLSIVSLAIWAGDAETAMKLLDNYTFTPEESPSPFQYPVLASLRGIRRRLKRRIKEYSALAEYSGLPSLLSTRIKPLESSGGHVRAVIWPESEREYELRCYLVDLSWEQAFYIQAARLAAAAGNNEAQSSADQAGYGVDIDTLSARDAVASESVLDIAWAMTAKRMFLLPEVSDFCTCTVRGIWTGRDLPSSAEEVVDVFRIFLEEFDRKVPSDVADV